MAIAQLVEHWIVIPVVAGSIPVGHPKLQQLRGIATNLGGNPFNFIRCVTNGNPMSDGRMRAARGGPLGFHFNSASLLFSTHMDKVEMTVIDPRGNLDGSGVLKCEGPNESAYVCVGTLKLMSDPLHDATIVVAESFFQKPIKGKVNFNGEDFPCHSRDASSSQERT